MKKYFLLFASLFLIAACTKEKPVHLPTAEEQRNTQLAAAEDNKKLQMKLEQSRGTALENIKTNVAGYFAVNPRFQPASDWSIIAHTDDYIDQSCLSGSGWGWANIMNPTLKNDKGQPTKFKVVCSTTSASLGCYIENDFATSPYAAKAKKCDTTLPFPIMSLK